MVANIEEKDGFEMCWNKYQEIVYPGLDTKSEQYDCLKEAYMAGWYDVLRILTSDAAQDVGILDLAKNMELRIYQKIKQRIEENKKGNIDGQDK